MAVITVSEAGGKSNASGSYVGATLPTENDDVVLGEKSGTLELVEGFRARSLEAVAAFKNKLTSTAAVGNVIIGGSTVALKADKFIWNWKATGGLELKGAAVITFAGIVAGAEVALFLPGTGNFLSAVLTFSAGRVTFEGGMLTTGKGEVSISAATVDMGSFTHELGGFKSTGTSTRELKATGTFKLIGTGTIWAVTGTGVTVKITSSKLEFTDTSKTAKTFTPGGTAEYGTVEFKSGAETSMKITSSLVCKVFRLTGGPMKFVITKSLLIEIKEALWLKGEEAKLITMESNEAGKSFELVVLGPARSGPERQTVSWCSFKDVNYLVAEENCKLYALHSTNVSGNSAGIHFNETPEQVFTVNQAQSPTALKTPLRKLTASQAQTITRTATPLRCPTAEQAQSATVTMTPKRYLRAEQAQTATVAHSLTRTLSASQPQEASLTTTRVLHVTLSAEQAQAASLAKALGRAVAASQGSSTTTPQRALARTLTNSQPQTVTVEGEVGKSEHTLQASQGSSASLVRSPTRVLSATAVSNSTPVQRAVARTLSVAVTQVVSCGRGMSLHLSSISSPSVSMTRALRLTLAASDAQAAALEGEPQRGKLFVVSQPQAVSFTRAVRRTLRVSQPQVIVLIAFHKVEPFLTSSAATESTTTTVAVSTSTSMVAGASAPAAEASVIP